MTIYRDRIGIDEVYRSNEGAMMTTTTEIYQKLTTIFRDVFDEDNLSVTPQTTADDVDGWDSLTHVRLVLAVSKAFGVRFSAAEIGSLKNVGEFATLIEQKV